MKRLAVAAGAVIVTTAAGLVGAAPVGAVSPGEVQPGETICTDLISADAGVVLSGTSTVNNGVGPLWTVRVASTPAGPEQQVLRTPGHTRPPTSVIPPAPGTWFFRGCVKNTAYSPSVMTIQLSPI